MVFHWKFNRLFSFVHYCYSNVLFCKFLRSTLIKQNNEVDNEWRRNASTMRTHKIRHNIRASILYYRITGDTFGETVNHRIYMPRRRLVNCTAESYSGWVVLERGGMKQIIIVKKKNHSEFVSCNFFLPTTSRSPPLVVKDYTYIKEIPKFACSIVFVWNEWKGKWQWPRQLPDNIPSIE